MKASHVVVYALGLVFWLAVIRVIRTTDIAHRLWSGATALANWHTAGIAIPVAVLVTLSLRIEKRTS